jgi:hypothetical protein
MCNHVLEHRETVPKTAVLVRSSDLNYDVIDSNNIVSSITSVYKDQDGSEDLKYYYQPHLGYEPFTHNKIMWVGIHKPNPGDTYIVDYETTKLTATQYDDPENCPRCGGKGWYVGLLDNDENKIYSVTGINKMMQDIIKIMLTIKNSNYGTLIPSMAGTQSADIDTMVTQIASAIRDVESQYMKMQLDLIANGAPLPDDEKLYKIEIRDIQTIQGSEQDSTFFVSITAYSVSGQSVDVDINI